MGYRRAGCVLAIALLLPTALVAQTQVVPMAGAPIEVLSGTFGKLGKTRKLDIAARLREVCAGADARCDVFCSETSFGRYRVGTKPICRVSFRCPDGTVRSVEAAKEELILMRCPEVPAAEPAVDELAPLGYTPPDR